MHCTKPIKWCMNGGTGSQGGAIYMANGTSLAIEDSSFVGNSASTGGGIFMSRVTDTYIYNNYFYHNNVTQAGGGINAGMHNAHSL